MHNVFSSISTNFGMPPFSITALAVDTKDNDGIITSLFFILYIDNARLRAAVPLFTATQLFELVYFENFSSNFCTLPTPSPDAQK